MEKVAKPGVLIFAAVFAACGAPQAASTLSPTDSSTGATPTAAIATAVPATQAAPKPTNTPEPQPAVKKIGEYLIPWQSDSYAEANVVVEVKNTGGTWVELQAFQSDFTIYDGSGNVAATGSFLYAYPKYLAPGATGYLAEEFVSDDVKAKDLKKLEANVYFAEVDEANTCTLTTAKLKNVAPKYEFEGPTTTGTVTNPCGARVDSAAVAAFYFDSTDKLLGFSSTNLVENLESGQTKGFSTVSGAPHLRLSEIDRTLAVASPTF